MNNRTLGGLFLLSSLTLVGCSTSENIPKNTSSSSPSVSASANTIATWVDTNILAPEGLSLAQDKVGYLTGSADLNGDGIAEHIVLMQDLYFCGSGGCTAVMFDNEGNVINRMTVVKNPVVLADSYRNGWQDFIVWSNGAHRVMSYNGESYPSNPSLEPTVNRNASRQSAIANVMATELYQQDGYDIMPSEAKKLWTPANVYHFSFKHYGDPDSIYQAAVDMTNGDVDIEAVALPQ
ncbi:hypothetical protein L3V77_05120 [Vibrio sp. DW001]|uniref:hypothetical protein n=1 Tax=Vibrio sp. DW001 TaxID=2912315 RepID=UPI0023AFEECA|nr:hypothetical protein [Vibrio sp. DW001]WED27619.1 hypothetical protein L3V77_05120 [Vibrio sp. DW001]